MSSMTKSHLVLTMLTRMRNPSSATKVGTRDGAGVFNLANGIARRVSIKPRPCKCLFFIFIFIILNTFCFIFRFVSNGNLHRFLRGGFKESPVLHYSAVSFFPLGIVCNLSNDIAVICRLSNRDSSSYLYY